MTNSIRTVTVEFLRKGPAHNQLLSPLTDYIGLSVPFPLFPYCIIPLFLHSIISFLYTPVGYV